MKIIIVDDDKLIRESLGDIIKELLKTAEVIIFEGAGAAWNYMNQKEGKGVDIIFSDIQMPGCMDGLEFLEKVKEKFSAVKFIAMSGNLVKEAEYRRRAIENGADFLFKPYKPQELFDLLDSR
ncbi:response regulator [Candidatus Falkowbacteria bacterium]|nr:response regulator [Candidatus Falkowbacteria bacterium]